MKPQEVEKDKRKLSYKEKLEFDSLEDELANLETEKEELAQKLSDPTMDNDGLMKAGERLSKVVQEIETKTDRWLELAEFA